KQDARGCFSLGDEKLITEYQELRVAAVRDVEGYLNAGRAMARLADEPMVQDLHGIDCPTLVIAGETDPYCPPRASENIARGIPGAELEIVPRAGHCLHWEASDATNQLIHDFLKKHP
ncbi:MAG: alpha/beta fold hydrolase, partial [Rhodobacteraceae bacterium]|nr:alpha/beta fold hydrolase [Paracoccaceae bacterium]